MTDSDQVRALEQRVGNPLTMWGDLKELVGCGELRQFRDVRERWLALMWALDSFRSAGLVPSGADDVDVLNRHKGNWFSELLALLLQNRTSQQVGSRQRVEGFSQMHQIDLAWPARQVDPLICAEAKVTGGPAYGRNPERGALSDWSNRRKELKFAATDLKLFRRQQETRIEHWDVWRKRAYPMAFLLWGARLSTGSRRDSIDKLAREAAALTSTYLDGAGLFSWQLRSDGGGYEPVESPLLARTSDLDDVLYRIESEINALTTPSGQAPEPQLPPARAVEAVSLSSD